MQDASAAADKVYSFYGNGFLSTIYERQLSPTGDKRIVSPGYSTDAIGRLYISSTTTIIDPGTSNAQTQKTEQTLDVYGNLLSLKQYHYAAGSATPTLARTYDYGYLNTSNYANLHIFNRLVGVTVQKPGSSAILLVANTYDNGGTLVGFTGTPRQWDSTVTSYRGNLTKSVTPGATKNIYYTTVGTVNSADDNNGHSVSVTMDSSANYAVPSAVTTSSLSTSFTWNSFLGLTQSTAPNSAVATQTYDSYSRPTQSTDATGQAVTYAYTATTKTATTSGRWTKTTVDGLGRTSKVETGHGTGGSAVTVAVVDTLYTPCACSPMGKVWKVSLPHAPGAGTVYWTEYVYDALGRTVQVKQPNNSGTATYAYAGNTVTSTDAAGKWKLFESDAMGNLTKVTEPNPAGGANYETSYAYSELGQLLTVTQTRTFVYDSNQRLYTVTNPENGTTTHFYNADGTLNYKTTANGTKITYTYDSLRRVTAIRRYINSSTEDTDQRTDFEYDGNSVASGFSQNVSGRLGVSTTRINATKGYTAFHEMYSYDPAGRVVKKRLRVVRTGHTADKDLEYSYNGALLSTMKYPDNSTPYTYTYDSMLRPTNMTGPGVLNQTIDIVKNVSYNVAGRMTAFTSLAGETDDGCGFTWCITQTYINHTFTFNERNELTRQQSGSVADISYEYSSSADNGQILSRTNAVTQEKVSYQYDSLKRLVAATAVSTYTSATTWATTYGFDGFGNLLSKTPTVGSAPSLSVTVNASTNRINSGGFSYDANGNMTSAGTFDVENRLVTAGGEEYGYLSNNQRIYKLDATGKEWIYLHDASGKRVMQYELLVDGSGNIALFNTGTAPYRNVYFAGRMVILKGNAVVTDRLGSVVGGTLDYFPYGEEKTSTANPADKFGTYMRDATGLDYAQQRYFSSATGRFLGSDPYQGSARKTSPRSWNRYAYVAGDPVNRNDPRGLCDVVLGGITQSSDVDGLDKLANLTGAVTVYPYAGDGGSALAGIIGVTEQMLAANSATKAALEAILIAAQNPGPINIFAFSGGSQAFSSAMALLPADISSRIQNVTYVSPGVPGGGVGGSGITTVFIGANFVDPLLNVANDFPSGTNFIFGLCGHDASCWVDNFQADLLKLSGSACSSQPVIRTLESPALSPFLGGGPWYYNVSLSQLSFTSSSIMQYEWAESTIKFDGFYWDEEDIDQQL